MTIALLILCLAQQTAGMMGNAPVSLDRWPLAITGRTFHRMSLGQLAKTPYPRAEICGPVVYIRRQRDADTHVTLDDGTARVVLEIVPELPIVPPRKGQIIRARGIVRLDKQHGGWAELHPVLSWIAVKACGV